MRRLRVGDDVMVIRGEGRERHQRGKVLRVIPSKGQVVVEGVNTVKRHMRQGPQRAGGIVQIDAPIDMSKVMLVDPQTGKPTRVRVQVREDGTKVRVAKSGAVIGKQE
jgi:large subunit ribosomal protein L24